MGVYYVQEKQFLCFVFQLTIMSIPSLIQHNQEHAGLKF